jgi:hypothetical protein
LADVENDFIQRLQIPVKLAAQRGVRSIFVHRKRIYDKFVTLCKECRSEAEFEAKSIADFEIFCLRFYEVQYKLGHKNFISAPLYISPSQLQLSLDVDRFDKTYAVFNRQTGKTTFAGLKGAQIFLRDRKSVQNFFAPSEEQLEMFAKVREVLNHPHLLEHYINKPGGINKVTKMYSPVLKSVAVSKTLASQSGSGGDASSGKSQFKRGASGILWVDEYSLVGEVTKKEVLAPMRASVDADTTAIYTMTPKLSFDPNLDREIEAAIKDPNVGYYHTHMFQSALEMRTDRGYIIDRFGDGPDGLHIPCPYGRMGHCPAYYRELYEEDPEEWAQFERWVEFECSEVCKLNDTLLQEDWAEFPQQGGRYYPIDAIRDAGKPYHFPHHSEIIRSRTRIMAVDWGLDQDPTVVVVWEVSQRDGYLHAKLLYWRMRQKGPGMEDEQLDDVKRDFYNWSPRILFIDATQATLFFQRNLCKPHTENAAIRIPRNMVYANETMKKKKYIGCDIKGPFKSECAKLWRGLMRMPGTLEVPDQDHEPDFWQWWWEDHFSVKATAAHDGQYNKFGVTGHTHDACILAALGITGVGVRKVLVGVI